MELEGYLAPCEANFEPLTPASFLLRAVESFPGRDAIVWRDYRWTYKGLADIASRLVNFLSTQGIGRGDVVSILCANRPELLAAHFAVPAMGAVLNAINIRLDADSVAYILSHAGSHILLSDQASLAIALAASAKAGVRCVAFSEDGLVAGEELGLLSDDGETGAFSITGIGTEWQALCLNYTSGTTGVPKGVAYHHRGAYLNALGNVMALGFDRKTAYLWTLPMFHCNGWCHPWAVTAAGGLHVCLDRASPDLILAAIERHRITHFACAPVVLYMLLEALSKERRPRGHRILVGTGGAAPTSILIEELDAAGIDVVHLYGLTESYGPVTLGTLPDALAQAPAREKAAFLARQGVCHPTANHVRVMGKNGADVPADGATLGEVQLRGNTLMAGYYKDAVATRAAFTDGWMQTGDLAIRHSDGSIELKDRLKDVIISGGENISSLEVESILHRHKDVLLAAVVAAPDPKWGEVPCAFVELRAGHVADAEALRQFCRERLAGFKVPRRFVFQELPKTATGKIQKYALRKQAATQ